MLKIFLNSNWKLVKWERILQMFWTRKPNHLTIIFLHLHCMFLFSFSNCLALKWGQTWDYLWLAREMYFCISQSPSIVYWKLFCLCCHWAGPLNLTRTGQETKRIEKVLFRLLNCAATFPQQRFATLQRSLECHGHVYPDQTQKPLLYNSLQSLEKHKGTWFLQHSFQTLE